MSQEEAVCNLYEWVLPLRPFPSYRFRPFSSCLPVLSLPVFHPFSSCLPSLLFLSFVLSLPVFLLRLPPSKTKTLNVITLMRYQKTKT